MERTCSIFGHAPSALPAGYDRCLYNIDLIFRMRDLVDAGIKHFITGLVPGVDLWCARTLVSYMQDGKCFVHGYMRYPPVCADIYDQRRIHELRNELPFIAESTTLTPRSQTRWMINDSTDVFVVTAGSAITYPVLYAQKMNKRLTVVTMESIIESQATHIERLSIPSPTIPHDGGEK